MAGRANSGHSEVDYAHLFELSSIMFCVADFSGRIVNINHAWESQLGYRVEDLVGVEYLALVHPDDMEATRGLIRQLNGAGSVAGFINRYRSAAGEYRHIEWQATVAGELIYASAVDVTQRERAIIALRRSEARHRRLFEVTTQGVIYEDANGRILDANPAAQEILGMTMEQLSGRTSLDAKWRAIHEDGSAFPGPEHPAMIALATGREVRDVTMGVFNAEQDRYRWVRIRAIPELEPGTGQVQDVSVTFDDISAALSDRAQIEAQNASLREAMAEQTEYRAQLDSMMAAVNRHAIVSVTDLDGRITAFNDNFTKISQYSADELLGNTHRVINSGHHPKEFFTAMWETIKAGHTWQGEICNRAKDGTLYWVLSTIQPFRDARGQVVQYVSIRTDITAQKAAELAAAAANQSKSRFLATMSHEIRTPLTAIIGLSHLADDSGLEPGVAASLAQIRASGEHLLAMLNDVLDFSKIEVSELDLRSDPIDPGDVVIQAAAMHRSMARTRGLELETQVGPEVPPAVLGDELRLRQVLLNLVSNAVKCTESGAVRVSVSAGPAGADGTVPLTFVVADTGSGISQGDLRRIFDPFVQADSEFTRTVGGTGLGLAISSHLVTMMGGQLEVESQLGLGSTFHFTLPMLPVAAELVTARRTELATPTQLSGRVLLVEDNMVNRTIASRMLARAGLEVQTAGNGAEAVALFLGDQPPCDIVLMDIHMPVLDGWEATRQIRALPAGRTVPIVALTANALTGDREACLAAGMDDHMAKPFDPSGLTATLARWLPAPRHGAQAPIGDLGTSGALTQRPAGPDSAWGAPALDRLAGLRTVDGDAELYAELLEMFAEDAPMRVEILREAIAAGNQEDVRRTAHFLKGSALALGATSLAASAAELEALAGAGGAGVDCALGVLEDVAAVLSQTPGLIRELTSSTAPEESPVSALDELEQCLGTSEWVSPELLARARAELTDRLVPVRLSSDLLAAVESYDFRRANAALAMIHDLAESGGGI